LGEDGLKLITQLINSIYVTGEWPRFNLSYNDCHKEEAQKLQNAATIAQSA
jgi:hypothetical protein